MIVCTFSAAIMPSNPCLAKLGETAQVTCVLQFTLPSCCRPMSRPCEFSDVEGIFISILSTTNSMPIECVVPAAHATVCVAFNSGLCSSILFDLTDECDNNLSFPLISTAVVPVCCRKKRNLAPKLTQDASFQTAHAYLVIDESTTLV